MGKRKSKQVVAKKVKKKVATVFDCPFCHHSESVTCKMEKSTQVGSLKCRVCGITFETKIEAIHDPIDVYSEWIDQCEALDKQAKERAKQGEVAADELTGGL